MSVVAHTARSNVCMTKPAVPMTVIVVTLDGEAKAYPVLSLLSYTEHCYVKRTDTPYVEGSHSDYIKKGWRYSRREHLITAIISYEGGLLDYTHPDITDDSYVKLIQTPESKCLLDTEVIIAITEAKEEA